MRIAMFSAETLHSINSGGLGVHVTELAAGLTRRGHEVHVFTRRHLQHHYDCIDAVHYHRVDHGLAHDAVSTMDYMCKAMAHRFHEVTSMIGKFDLAHAHDWSTANAMKYVIDGFRTPGILTMHSTEYGRAGNVFHNGYAKWIRDTESSGCHNATALIAVSYFLADELRRIYWVPGEKIHVVHNGVNYRAYDGFLNPAEIKARYGLAPMTPTVMAIARMTAQKGIDLLVDSVPMVRASYPDVKYIIVGDGPDRDYIVRRAHEIGAAGSIIFLSSPSRQELIDLKRSVDIFAVPSRNEPFGIVVLEAWAAGKPVVATLAGGPREFIWHDVNGFLVETHAHGLAHGIGSLLADHEHCRALGRNGRQAVETAFNWDRVAANTEGVYYAVA
ncbi:MAG: glycosyltransferase family 4 protein [Deltaproteobacteria bacterium]|nr:glycosyltransferase family 4 protein [Deltaproteobacteria bacterium]